MERGPNRSRRPALIARNLAIALALVILAIQLAIMAIGGAGRQRAQPSSPSGPGPLWATPSPVPGRATPAANRAAPDPTASGRSDLLVNYELFHKEGYATFADSWLSILTSCSVAPDTTVTALNLPGLRSRIDCDVKQQFATPVQIYMHFDRYDSLEHASLYMGCGTPPPGAPPQMQATKAHLGTAGSKSGYYCEYFLARDLEVMTPNVTVVWTGDDGHSAFQGQLQYVTDDAHAAEALDHLRGLWVAYA